MKGKNNGAHCQGEVEINSLKGNVLNIVWIVTDMLYQIPLKILKFFKDCEVAII